MILLSGLFLAAGLPGAAFAHCGTLPDHAQLRAALQASQGEENGGLGFHMWGALVDREGTICAIAYSGEELGDQWPGSRMISAQKAYTANAFSLPEFALSTANLFIAAQPGGTLYGLQFSNPIDSAHAYTGDPRRFGTEFDPLVGRRIGGINVFGGGLPLYTDEGELISALGVSGDTSCADHIIAWRTRSTLALDHVPSGVAPGNNDNIIFDVADGVSSSGYGHPACSSESAEIVASFVTAPSQP